VAFRRTVDAGYVIWFAIAMLALAAGFRSPLVFSPSNVEEVMRAMSILGIVAVGQTLVVASGGMDLSAGMVMGLVTVTVNGLMNGDSSLALPLSLLALAIGLGIGMVNGLLVSTLRIHPLILTFGMFWVIEGAIFVYTDKTIGKSASNLHEVAYGSIGVIPISFLIMLFAGFIGWMVLHRTVFGRYTLALGGSEEYSRRHGIGIRKMKIAVYSLSGLSAGLAGLILAARLGAGYPLAGQGFELDPIVAVVLGGTPITGGKGTIIGSLGGALLLTLLSNALNLNEISPYVQQVVKGIVITVAIVLYARRRAS
jgi:ribose transport system permease protein